MRIYIDRVVLVLLAYTVLSFTLGLRPALAVFGFHLLMSGTDTFGMSK